ncbi:MAG: ribosome biogenesis factor YjgA [Caldimonas sp.]|uniref:ribosome biogenesis factor YjgA n=1 Tax=Caldimonas sp. TaxID=2838790 RepID=UPI00391AECD7
MPLPPRRHPDDPDTVPADERPSKTRLKQLMHELQALGEELVQLPDSRFERLALPESLVNAVQEYKRTRSHEGRRRQMQYIGKLMRQIDPEPVREAVAEMKLGRALDSLALHEAERWRSELLADDEALTRWMADHPASDAQQLRSLIRAARKDAAATPDQRSARAYRELFQYLKARLATEPPPPDEDT